LRRFRSLPSAGVLRVPQRARAREEDA
jgi:hypothetical protein